MKQGQAKTINSGGKTQPNSKAVSVAAVSEIGLQYQDSKGPHSESLYKGRGLSAPMVGASSHKAGSQGKH